MVRRRWGSRRAERADQLVDHDVAASHPVEQVGALLACYPLCRLPRSHDSGERVSGIAACGKDRGPLQCVEPGLQAAVHGIGEAERRNEFVDLLIGLRFAGKASSLEGGLCGRAAAHARRPGSTWRRSSGEQPDRPLRSPQGRLSAGTAPRPRSDGRAGWGRDGQG